MQQKKLIIAKDPVWSPLKCSIIESSYGNNFILKKKKYNIPIYKYPLLICFSTFTSTPVPQKTDQFITDIKNLIYNTKYNDNQIGNSSVSSKDDVNAITNHYSNYIRL